MSTSLVFAQLPSPLNPKLLRDFQRDAGWDDNPEAPQATAHPGGQVKWVAALSGKKTVAIARLELAPPHFCYVSELIVLSGHRGRGVGEWFVKQIEMHCFQERIPRVVLQAKEDARAFYEKLHFVADPLAAGFMKKEVGLRRRATLSALR